MKAEGRLRWSRVTWMIVLMVSCVVGLSMVAFAAANPNETCLSCHDTEGFSTTLDNGNEMNLYVSGKTYLQSVHGEQEFTCDNCHEGYTEYPHPEKTFKSQRGFALQLSDSCANCHTEEQASYAKDFHGSTGTMRKLLGATTKKAVVNAPEAVCADCHGAHDILRSSNPASRTYPDNLAGTCQNCHEKATPQFALAFGNHKPVTPSDPTTAVTYWINQFYQVVVPALVGSLVLFMLLELVFMLRQRRLQNKKA